MANVLASEKVFVSKLHRVEWRQISWSTPDSGIVFFQTNPINQGHYLQIWDFRQCFSQVSHSHCSRSCEGIWWLCCTLSHVLSFANRDICSHPASYFELFETLLLLEIRHIFCYNSALLDVALLPWKGRLSQLLNNYLIDDQSRHAQYWSYAVHSISRESRSIG